jgi:zinc resistance-associated protein
METPMWKAVIAGIAALWIAGPAFAHTKQPSQADRPRMSADDMAALTDARIAARKAALKLTPDQEQHWPALEQALRDISKERRARREERRTVERRADAIQRLRDRADALTTRAGELRRIADAAQPLYQSLDEAQKRRFNVMFRLTERRPMVGSPRERGTARDYGH